VVELIDAPRPLLPVVLAAGIGSRLGGQPKALFPVGGRPLLDLAVEALAAEGFDFVFVVTGHRAEEVRGHAGTSGYPLECVFLHNEHYADLNNFHSVRVAADAAEAYTLLIVNCDIVFGQCVLRQVASVSAASLGLLVEQGSVDAEAMKVELDDGIVTRIGKRIPSPRAFGEFIGLSTLAPAARAAYVDAADEALRSGERELYYEDIYGRICRKIDTRVATVAPGSWAEVDAHADVAAAARVAADRVGKPTAHAAAAVATAIGSPSR
jgi:choline kinase